MHTIDFIIIIAYFIIMIGAGMWFSRESAQDMRAYFLGHNKSKWWMLAASGASSHYSLVGTIWLISMLMVVGMKSWWTCLIWWMPNAIFLMAYMGIWIRRTGAMTAGELNKVRFGVDGGAKAARVSFAVMVMFFSIAQLALSYIVLHKFAQIFGFPPDQSAMLVMGITGVYVLVGGFRGVIFTDFLQTILLCFISFAVGWICFKQITGAELAAALNHGGVTVDYWKSFAFDAAPMLGAFAKNPDYAGWKDFTGMVVASSVVGLIGCIGGAGGRYGEQRFLAARNGREAGLLAGLWQFLGLPRWVLVAALALLGFVVFREQTVLAANPDAVIPLFLQSHLLGAGLKGLIIAGLIAAFMANMSSEINSAASIMVRDILQPLSGRHQEDEQGGMIASYVATALLVVSTIALGYLFVRSTGLNQVWMWMLGGLVTSYVLPLALRWYWGRMNGWGYAVGSLVGLIPSFFMLSKQFVGRDAWVQRIPNDWFTYAILLLSLITCVAVSLLTKPVDAEHIDKFYRQIRPLGWWGDVRRRVEASGQPMNAPLRPLLIVVNIPIGIVASYALYMIPVYVLGKWFAGSLLCLTVFLACCLALYFTWYRALPKD